MVVVCRSCGDLIRGGVAWLASLLHAMRAVSAVSLVLVRQRYLSMYISYAHWVSEMLQIIEEYGDR